MKPIAFANSITRLRECALQSRSLSPLVVKCPLQVKGVSPEDESELKKKEAAAVILQGRCTPSSLS